MTSRSSSRQARFAGEGLRDDLGDGRIGREPGAAPARAEQPVDRILTSLDRLGERIRALSNARDEAAAPPRRPAAPPPPPAEPAPRRAATPRGVDLQRAIDEIARKRDALERRPDERLRPSRAAEEPAPPRRAAEARVAETRAPETRSPEPEPRTERAAVPRDRREAAFVDDLRGDLRDLRRSVERLDVSGHAEALRDLGSRIDDVGRSAADQRGLAALREDVAHLREIVLEAAATNPARALAGAYDEIVERLEEMRGAIDNPRALADLVQRLGEVRRALGGLASDQQAAAILDRLDGLSDRLDRGVGHDAVSTLTAQVGALATAVKGLDHRDAVHAVEIGLADVVEQMLAVERRLGRLDNVERWQENVERQNALLSQLAQRAEQLPRVAHEMERQTASVEGIARTTEAIPRIAADVEALRRSLDPGATARGLEQLGSRIDGLAGRVSALAPPPESDADLARRLAEISDRLAGVDARAGAIPDVAALVERHGRSLDEVARSVGAVPRMAADLDGLRRAVERTDPAAGTAALLERIDDLAARVDRMGSAREVLADPGFESRLAEIVQRLERIELTADPVGLDALEPRFDCLARIIEEKLSAAAPAAAVSGVPEGLIEALERIERHLDADRSETLLVSLEGRILDLARSLDGVGGRGGPDLGRIESTLSDLRDDVGRLAMAPAGLDRELRQLADRVDLLVSAPQPDPDALARIEDRLADIAGRLDARPSDAAEIADALARFEQVLGEALDPVRAAAAPRDDARALDAGIALVQRDLAALQDDLRAGARRDRELLTAIGEAVERLATRDLEASRQTAAALSAPPPAAEARREPPRPASSPAARAPEPPRPAARRMDEDDSAAWREIERTLSEGLGARLRGGDVPAATAAPTAAVDLDADEDAEEELPRLFGRRDDAPADLDAPPAVEVDVNRPLEPGSGKPARAAARGAAAAAAPAGRKGEERPRAELSKADFIAAARRAAQAAGADLPGNGRRGQSAPPVQAPAAEAPAEEAAPAPRRGRFALRLPEGLRLHRRKIMVAVLVLAVAGIGARVATTFLGGSAPTVTVDATPPAASAPAPAAETARAETPTAAAPAPAAAGAAPEAASEPPGDAVADARSAADPAAGPAAPAPSGAAPADGSEPGALAQLPPGPSTSFAPAPDGTVAGAPAPGKLAPPAGALPAPPEAVGPLALRQAAQAGNPVAQFEVAARLTEGRGVAQNLAEAVRWYGYAAEAGLAPAQYRLGSLYEKGQGVPRDTKTAGGWYAKAAAVGNAKAMHNLAVLYAEGGLGQPDYDTAAGWFQKAADLGVRDSQYNLGILYARGLGVPRDLTASYKWFAIAAAAGDGDSAKKRDDVAQVLDKDALARARLAVESWKPQQPTPAANDVATDDPAWSATPESAAATVGGGDLVVQAQTLLARHGYDVGPADGKMGRKTRDAVAAFRKAKGLPATGAVDDALIRALAEQAI